MNSTIKLGIKKKKIKMCNQKTIFDTIKKVRINYVYRERIYKA